MEVLVDLIEESGDSLIDESGDLLKVEAGQKSDQKPCNFRAGIADLGGLSGPSYRKAPWKRWGASPPTFSSGLCGRRGPFRVPNSTIPGPEALVRNLKYVAALWRLLPQSPLEKVGGFAPHLFQWALR